MAVKHSRWDARAYYNGDIETAIHDLGLARDTHYTWKDIALVLSGGLPRLRKYTDS
mgnify:CR=1 FL=1